MPCAHIDLRHQCGFANGGSEAWVVNDRHDTRVRATVRESWQSSGTTHHTDTAYTLEAGADQQVGCTSGPTGNSHSFSVVGCAPI